LAACGYKTFDVSSLPSLSVFMPAYNAERYVRAAIESVLDNGFADFELVVVDDASTDSTAQIIEAIRHPALRFVRQAENLGVGATRQAAISLLRGQYVALLDADDVAIPGRFQRQVDRLGAADGPDILGGGLEMFGEVQGTLTFPLTDAAIKCALLFHDLPLANPTICMRLNPFRSGRLAYKPQCGAEDYALWVDGMHAGLQFENLSGALTRYRRHTDSLTYRSHDLVRTAAREVRARVVQMFFPAMPAATREALVRALSVRINDAPGWIDGIHGIAHAAKLADSVADIDGRLMVSMLEDHLLRMTRMGLTSGVATYDLLESATESSEHLAEWRAHNNGDLDRRIVALAT